MMDFAGNAVTVLITAGIIVSLTGGTKMSKICTSVVCVLAAISVIAPIMGRPSSFVRFDVEEDYEDARNQSAVLLADECRITLEDRVKDALVTKFPDIGIISFEIVTDAHDTENIVICGVNAEIEGVRETEVVKFLSELLGCPNVKVNEKGDKSE